MEYLFLALILLGIPFVLPIALWVSTRRLRTRIAALEETIETQRAELLAIAQRLRETPPEGRVPSPAAAAPAEPEPVRVAPVPVAPIAPPVRPPAPPRRVEPVVPVVPPEPPPFPVPAAPVVVPPASPPRSAPPSEPPSAPPPSRGWSLPAFDIENLVGVKLFSAVAGIALVVAAVYFLRYSIDHGWLQPAVRVAIGILVAVALLVVCELKAARRYPLTANAMDAAAIAILFATFFAAHALWDLIPALVTFALLAMVTVVAVLLSIRRESLFIAVLGLLGGFATPALLSTGENRPIPLFAYLLLLNIGLAWVATTRGWRVLTWLTLIFTTLYQWGWVFTFLDRRSVSLAMGIFLVFPLAAVAQVLLRGQPRDGAASGDAFDRTALLSASLPLFFAVYLASTPAYTSNPALLFGFLLLVDLGLLAIAIARRQELLHAAGALATMAVAATWIATSYTRGASAWMALAFTATFVALYLAAPVAARWFARPFTGYAARAEYASPGLLFVLPVLAAIEPSFVEPWPLMGTLLALVLLIAWRAIADRAGRLYYVAAFFAIATQAVWSTAHLTLDRLSTAVTIYAVFGLASLGVPIAARRADRPLTPAWGSGAVLLVSLGLLLFLSLGPVAPAALWALALLLAITNAGLFIESAAGGLPVLAQAGSVCSWIVLMAWWARTAGSVGILPSLTVVVGLTLVTLAGHSWSTRSRSAIAGASSASFAQGLYLGLIGQLFLFVLASDRTWALPPWPIFGALAVMTLATSAAALWMRNSVLHAAGIIAAALVVTSWSGAAGAPAWGLTVVMAAAAASAYALAWMPLADRFDGKPHLARSAAAVLFIGECSLLVAVESGARPPFVALLAAHAVNLAVLLTLTARYWWPHVAVAAVIPAWMVVLQWQRGDVASRWEELLILSASLYAIFAVYPFVAGRRSSRDPYLAAVVASAMAFFGARAAFLAGGLEWMIGVIPVIEGAVLALLLRDLLRSEAAGERDLGRLALVAGAALAFVTVAIPLQLHQQWITIGWALEGAALAWLFRRVPHRGLFYAAAALLGTVFVRLALNPEVLHYEPRGSLRIVNWYLYAYLVCAAAMLVAARFLVETDDRLPARLRLSTLLPGAAVILLFLLLNIEIADFYATGPAVMFRFGVTVAQDLTYTIGWLLFGMGLLAAGIWQGSRAARITAVALIAVTTFKCFLYDLASLEGLARIGSFVGLAISLALVSMALQKYVLRPRTAS